MIPIIAGPVRDARCTAGDIPFSNLDPLTKVALVPGNPDIYYGARPEQLHRDIREELEGSIIPTTQKDAPISPNFFVVTKSMDRSLAVALRQAAYNGALGARAMHALQHYARAQQTPHDHACTFTVIYHASVLRMYTVHRVEPISLGPPSYHMHPVRRFAMPDSFETFEQGVTAYRNAILWTEEKRNEVIDQANKTFDANLQTESEQIQNAPIEESVDSTSTRLTTPVDGGADASVEI